MNHFDQVILISLIVILAVCLIAVLFSHPPQRTALYVVPDTTNIPALVGAITDANNRAEISRLIITPTEHTCSLYVQIR